MTKRKDRVPIVPSGRGYCVVYGCNNRTTGNARCTQCAKDGGPTGRTQ